MLKKSDLILIFTQQSAILSVILKTNIAYFLQQTFNFQQPETTLRMVPPATLLSFPQALYYVSTSVSFYQSNKKMQIPATITTPAATAITEPSARKTAYLASGLRPIEIIPLYIDE